MDGSRICIAASFLSVLLAQSAVAPSATPAMLSAPGRNIRLDVVANDSSGTPVSGLEQKDFTVLDNKQPRTVLTFEAATNGKAGNEPVEIILVLDAVNTSFDRVAFSRSEIKRFLQRDGGILRPARILCVPFRRGSSNFKALRLAMETR